MTVAAMEGAGTVLTAMAIRGMIETRSEKKPTKPIWHNAQVKQR